MSQENVEIVRLVLAAWAEGDFRSKTERFDPEAAFETFMPDADQNVVARGSEEIAAFTRDWLAQWQRYRIVAEEFQDVGADTVFVSVRQVAAGNQSGAEVESPGFSVWTLRRGKVVKLTLHYDRAEALEAAGLRE
ncbi:MAG: nuclear transport factor 2 family protein [Actinomycetota bacterium]|nr:nuclear transport factor 2 family protein [Actinomycetota bacterium]